MSRIRLSYFVEKASELEFSVELRDNVYEKDGLTRVEDGQEVYGQVHGRLVNANLSVQGFGANRRVDELSIQQTRSLALSLFDDNASLMGAETWLMQAEYISLKNKQDENHYDKVRKILLEVLKREIYDIFTNVDLDVTPAVYFKTNYGNVRQSDLSLGYKTLIA